MAAHNPGGVPETQRLDVPAGYVRAHEWSCFCHTLKCEHCDLNIEDLYGYTGNNPKYVECVVRRLPLEPRYVRRLKGSFWQRIADFFA